MNTVDLIASLIKSGRHEEAIQAVNELAETASALEGEREEMQARIAELEAEAREKRAWEGRYNALLEEAEASRPPEIDGGDASRGASRGVIAIDRDGRPWVCGNGFWWELIKNPDRGARELPEKYGPYTLVYIPTPKESTNE